MAPCRERLKIKKDNLVYFIPCTVIQVKLGQVSLADHFTTLLSLKLTRQHHQSRVNLEAVLLGLKLTLLHCQNRVKPPYGFVRSRRFMQIKLNPFGTVALKLGWRDTVLAPQDTVIRVLGSVTCSSWTSQAPCELRCAWQVNL